MPRFFTSSIDGDRAILTGEDASHITRSLRLRPGEAVTLCDGSGWDYEGIIASTGEEVTVDIREKRTSSTEPRGKITLYQALPKGDKMEWIIQKSVELGVFRIVPILTSRCVSRPDAKSMEKRYSALIKLLRKQPNSPDGVSCPKFPACSRWNRRQKTSPERASSFMKKAAHGWRS